MIRTSVDRRTASRRASQLASARAAVFRAMRNGQSLTRMHARGTILWRLAPSGTSVPDVVAQSVVADPRIVGVGDCLFPGLGCDQTYRWIE